MMKSGYILPLVLGIILVLSLMFAALLQVPGSLRRYTMRMSKEVQQIYDAESALMAYLRHIPQGYLKKLPLVDLQNLGPYNRACATFRDGEGSPFFAESAAHAVCVYTVAQSRALHYSEFHTGIFSYRESLRSRILFSGSLKTYSGNKRFFAPPQQEYIEVRDGDMRLDLDASKSVRSANFVVDGNVVVSGRAIFDTLRVFTLGSVQIRGGVRVRHLEVVAGESVDVQDSVRFRGLITAEREVTMAGRSVADFPSMAIAIGRNEPQANLYEHARFSGLLAAPAGIVNRDSSTVLDSANLVLPAFFEGEPIVFERAVLR